MRHIDPPLRIRASLSASPGNRAIPPAVATILRGDEVEGGHSQVQSAHSGKRKCRPRSGIWPTHLLQGPEGLIGVVHGVRRCNKMMFTAPTAGNDK